MLKRKKNSLSVFQERVNSLENENIDSILSLFIECTQNDSLNFLEMKKMYLFCLQYLTQTSNHNIPENMFESLDNIFLRRISFSIDSFLKEIVNASSKKLMETSLLFITKDCDDGFKEKLFLTMKGKLSSFPETENKNELLKILNGFKTKNKKGPDDSSLLIKP